MPEQNAPKFLEGFVADTVIESPFMEDGVHCFLKAAVPMVISRFLLMLLPGVLCDREAAIASPE